MGALGEEALALTVDEATMQEWHAAVTMIKFAPPSTYSTAPFDPHPARVRPVPARRTVANLQRPTPPCGSGGVAGARTAYWVALAMTLALMALL